MRPSTQTGHFRRCGIGHSSTPQWELPNSALTVIHVVRVRSWSTFYGRTWVGGEVRFHGSLQTDTTTVRRTRLVSHVRKQGSTGPLLVASLEHLISQDEHTAVIERQDVSRPVVSRRPLALPWQHRLRPMGGVKALYPPPHCRSVSPRPRSTAIESTMTHEYATQKEGYPGLVAHAPLTAILLAESASRRLGRPLRSFAYRA